jgi:hypothetical protein
VTKTLNAPTLVIQPSQTNITISNFSITFTQDPTYPNILVYNFEWDQDNITFATATPNNATVYIQLQDQLGVNIGPAIVVYPRHNFCNARHVPPAPTDYQNKEFPANVDVEAVVTQVILSAEDITYAVRSCASPLPPFP